MQDLTTFIANHMALSYTFAVLVVLLLIVEMLRHKRLAFNINVQQAVQLINKENANVIDIRTDEEFKKGHILDAIVISTDEIHSSSPKLEKLRKKPVIVVCQTGNDSQKVAAFLKKQGYNAYSLSGGLRAWSELSMPIVK